MVEQFIISMYTTMISWTYILLTVLIVVKIIQLIGKIGEGGGFRWPSWGGGDGPPRPGGDADDRRRRRPGYVLMFRAQPRRAQIALSWAANPEVDNVNYYEIQRETGRRRWWGATHWQRVASVDRAHPPNNPLMDEAIEGLSRYRIRAVNSRGRGKWSYTEARITRPIRRWHPVIDGVTVDAHGNTTFRGHVEIR